MYTQLVIGICIACNSRWSIESMQFLTQNDILVKHAIFFAWLAIHDGLLNQCSFLLKMIFWSNMQLIYYIYIFCKVGQIGVNNINLSAAGLQWSKGPRNNRGGVKISLRGTSALTMI